MIKGRVTENRELAEIVFTARDLFPGSSESKRQKAAKTLLNILERRIRNNNTRNAYVKHPHLKEWACRKTSAQTVAEV